VALGVAGTTLLDELNRLANGGTYRVPGAMVGRALGCSSMGSTAFSNNKFNRYSGSTQCDSRHD